MVDVHTLIIAPGPGVGTASDEHAFGNGFSAVEIRERIAAAGYFWELRLA
jgi:hypothetical protein